MRQIILFLIVLRSLSFFGQSIDSLKIVCPGYFHGSNYFPVVCESYYSNSKLFFSGSISNMEINTLELPESEIVLYKGLGSKGFANNENDNFQISISGFSQFRNVEKINSEPIILEGTLNTNTVLETGKVYLIQNELTVNEGVSLTIPEGTTIEINEKVNIFVNGKISCLGTENSPVFFVGTSIDKYWGGIVISNNANDTSLFNYTFFTHGGYDETLIFGHSQSQAVLKVDNAKVSLSNCFFLDNPGKALGGNLAEIKIKNCLISRCDTGGEFHFSKIELDSSYILTIPDASEGLIDDDNDGMYFYEVHPSGNESIISNSFFIIGKDDGIDHNGAKLNISNCWIEGFDNEGIACSNKNSVNLLNSLIKSCGQGIEAGYGNPSVNVNHSVFVNNNVGIRFGDNYNWGCTGQMIVTNSIAYNNLDNIKNFDVLTAGPVDNAISISYSITNDVDYNNELNCLEAIPLFETNYLLKPSSPGIAASNDGLDMGLLNSLTLAPEIKSSEKLLAYPNPTVGPITFSSEKFLFQKSVFTVYNSIGNTVLYTSFQPSGNLCEIDISDLPNGLYIVLVELDNQFYKVKIIKNETR